MNWRLNTIRIDDVPKVWPIVAPLLAKAVALSGGRYDMRAVLAQLRDERAQLWVVYDENSVVAAAFTARRAVYPCSSWLTIEFLGGEGVTEWLPAVEGTLTAYAIEAGLEGVEMVGRVGWTKPLAAFGWGQNAVMLSKTVAATGVNEAA